MWHWMVLVVLAGLTLLSIRFTLGRIFGDEGRLSVLSRGRGGEKQREQRQEKRVIKRHSSGSSEGSERRWKIILEDRVMTDIYEFIFQDSIGIGRTEDRNGYEEYLVVNDSRVSKTHCAIFSKGNKLYLQDEGSRNHTFLNGERIKKPMVIQKDDVISLGETRLEVLKVLRETK